MRRVIIFFIAAPIVLWHLPGILWRRAQRWVMEREEYLKYDSTSTCDVRVDSRPYVSHTPDLAGMKYRGKVIVEVEEDIRMKMWVLYLEDDTRVQLTYDTMEDLMRFHSFMHKGGLGPIWVLK